MTLFRLQCLDLESQLFLAVVAHDLFLHGVRVVDRLHAVGVLTLLVEYTLLADLPLLLETLLALLLHPLDLPQTLFQPSHLGPVLPDLHVLVLFELLLQPTQLLLLCLEFLAVPLHVVLVDDEHLGPDDASDLLLELE